MTSALKRKTVIAGAACCSAQDGLWTKMNLNMKVEVEFVAKTTDSDIIKTGTTKEVVDVHAVGKIDEKEWNRLLRNKNVLYRRE